MKLTRVLKNDSLLVKDLDKNSLTREIRRLRWYNFISGVYLERSEATLDYIKLLNSNFIKDDGLFLHLLPIKKSQKRFIKSSEKSYPTKPKYTYEKICDNAVDRIIKKVKEAINDQFTNVDITYLKDEDLHILHFDVQTNEGIELCIINIVFDSKKKTMSVDLVKDRYNNYFSKIIKKIVNQDLVYRAKYYEN